MNSRTRKLTVSAMFAAIAYLVMVVCRLPIVGAAPFLKYDPKDVILVICGFVNGPFAGATVALVVTLLELVTVSTSGFIGFVMNICASLAFVLPASLLYARRRELKSAVVGLVISILLMTAVMLLWNHFLTPLYQRGAGVSYAEYQAVVDGMLLPVFLPFNLIKGGLNMALTLMIYKPVTRALRSAKLLVTADVSATKSAASHRVGWIYIVGILMIAACIAAILLLR